jgi:hypothetical protein
MPTIVETAPTHAGTTASPLAANPDHPERARHPRRPRTARPAAPLDRPVWAVRLDRPDGSHTFVGPEPGECAAVSRRRREQDQWSAAGLWAPAATVVTMPAATFLDHARRPPGCTSTSCPRSADAVPHR